MVYIFQIFVVYMCAKNEKKIILTLVKMPTKYKSCHLSHFLRIIDRFHGVVDRDNCRHLRQQIDEQCDGQQSGITSVRLSG